MPVLTIEMRIDGAVVFQSESDDQPRVDLEEGAAAIVRFIFHSADTSEMELETIPFGGE